MVFYNFEGLKVHTRKDVEDIRTAVERRCKKIGRKGNMVVNYDACEIPEGVLDQYGAMVQ